MNKFWSICLLLFTLTLSAQEINFASAPEKKWVDSLYSSFTFEEKLGQLFMVAAYSNKDSLHIKSVENLIEKHQIGGLIFFQGGPKRQVKLTNRYQSKSKVPLFIGIDAEWGLSMRLDSTHRYPWNMTLGAVQDLKLIEKMGNQMAKQAKRMGVHFNFAPVLDVNTNPLNPIIGNRSFGENKEEVAARAIALTKGIQAGGVLATGKHFPGHGDTATDSHYTLPTLPYDKNRLEDIEWFPYKKIFNEGLASVMVAHLNVPSLEEKAGYPSSTSYNIVTNILKKELGFEGLIFTDALNMKGASNFKQPGDLDLEAFLAGNDILLFPENVPLAIEKLKEAYLKFTFDDARLEHSVKKILAYKYRVGLSEYKKIEEQNLIKDLNGFDAEDLNRELYENAVTLIKKSEALPIRQFAKEKIAYIKLGEDKNDGFLEKLKSFANITTIQSDSIATLLSDVNDFTKVIIGVHKADGAWKKHQLSDKEKAILVQVSQKCHVVLTVFAKPYTLKDITNFSEIEDVVLAYQNNEYAQSAAAQIIFGAIAAKGKLPVSINEEYKVGVGEKSTKLNILGFSTPLAMGLNPDELSKIDTLAQQVLQEKMTPGMQILVARKGKVIYQKSFGYHDYEMKTKVRNTDRYDLASLTKILATLPAFMQLVDAHKVQLTNTLGESMPDWLPTNKSKITFLDLLTHQSGLQAWQPFYLKTISEEKKPKETHYQSTYSFEFPIQVSESLFLKRGYNDSIIDFIKKSKLSDKKEYKYSDFGFIILQEFLKKQYQIPLDDLVFKNFYEPMGANSLSYNPLKNTDLDNVIPTEIDTYFRQTKVHGYVHDMAAAMMGGVAGHAGLFGNAIDVAKMMQLFLQKGNYGNKVYFKEKTMETFNQCLYCKQGNRRGVGFDKPQLSGGNPTCNCTSKNSFGHTGFTGTMAWADPDKDLIYVFLSNRTFPDASKNLISKNDIREKMQKIIYDAIIK